MSWSKTCRPNDSLPRWARRYPHLIDAVRTTFVVDPDNVIQHVYATNLNVGRNPKDTLRVLDALQTDELCPCNREVGGDVLKVA